MKVQEKYKPRSLDDIIISNNSVLNTIKTDISKNNKINYIIFGNNDHCKSLITELTINDYYMKNSSSVNIGDKYKYIYQYNCFIDINWSDPTNEINIFCRNRAMYKKFIIFDNCDNITFSQQQFIKTMMDQYYKNVNFIFITTNMKNINDVIKSRCKIIDIQPFKKQQIFNIMNKICKNEKIKLDKSIFTNNIITTNNKGISYFLNIINKAIILKYDEINYDNIDKLKNDISNKLFESYFLHMRNNNLKDACSVIDKMFNEGYDLGDIYFFMYNYIFDNENIDNKYDILNIITKYTVKFYNGYYNKIMILFFSNEIISIFN